MSMEDAVIESPDQEVEDSSDDLHAALKSAVAEVNERARDDQGRFAKQDDKPAAAEPNPGAQKADASQTKADDKAKELTQQADQSQQIAQAAQAAGEQVQQTPVKAPDAWSPAAKAKFATLDPEIQAEISRREAEVHKGFTKQDEHRNIGKTFSEAITPYLPMIRAEGAEPIQAVQNLLQTAHMLRQATPDQKQQMFIGLAQQYGVDLNGVFQRLAGGQQTQMDPQVAALQQQVQQLQQARQREQEMLENQTQTQINQAIESFSSDPKNVFFSNVKAEMAALLQSNRAKDLQEAYDMACWARPDIRPLLLQQQEQQRAAETKAKADKARLASGSITGSPAGRAAAPNLNQSASLEDDIRASMRDVLGRL